MQSLKELLEAHDVVTIAQVPLGNSKERFHYAVEQSDGVAWTSLQHARGDYKDVQQMASWAKELGIYLIVRLEHTEAATQATKVADMGASGITVPQIEVPSNVTLAAKSLYYPSQGKSPNYGGRRSGGSADRVGPFSQGNRTYADWWNNHTSIGAQIESLDVVRNFGRFANASIDGYDTPVVTYADFGPNDFQLDLGHILTYDAKSLSPDEHAMAETITKPGLPQDEWTRAMDYAISRVVESGATVAMRDMDRIRVPSDNSEFPNAIARYSEVVEASKEHYKGLGVKMLFFNPLHLAAINSDIPK